MKKLFSTLAIALSLSSCTSVKQIGKLNMVSTRNVDSKLNYSRISTYSGGSKRELKHSKAKTIEDAIDQTVKKVMGGEFLMNVKLYSIDGVYFAAEGDVWGPSNSNEINYRGFKNGDAVTWKKNGHFITGTITALKDDKTCYVADELGKTFELLYDNITKVVNTDLKK